jgi:DNA-binding NtrC family response regulator
MQSLSVVVANPDSQIAAQLASSLNQHFGKIALAGSLDELRHAIPKHRAEVAILDLEKLASIADLQRLAREFGHTSIVCTHRIPDEEMWAEALSAGAIDCCDASDPASIIDSVKRNVRAARAKAA